MQEHLGQRVCFKSNNRNAVLFVHHSHPTNPLHPTGPGADVRTTPHDKGYGQMSRHLGGYKGTAFHFLENSAKRPAAHSCRLFFNPGKCGLYTNVTTNSLSKRTVELAQVATTLFQQFFKKRKKGAGICMANRIQIYDNAKFQKKNVVFVVASLQELFRMHFLGETNLFIRTESVFWTEVIVFIETAKQERREGVFLLRSNEYATEMKPPHVFFFLC